MHCYNFRQCLPSDADAPQSDPQIRAPEKFCSLESLRQLLSDGLLDHTRTRKTDQCPRLCKNDISKHRKTCRYTAGCRIGQYRNIKKPASLCRFSAAEVFAICIREWIPSCILAPPEQANIITGSFSHCCPFYCTGNLFTDHLSHARHHKSPVTDTKILSFPAIHPCFSGYNRFIKPRSSSCSASTFSS